VARAFVMEFERPVAELEHKLASLKRLDLTDQPDLAAEIVALELEIEKLRETLYSSLSAWEKVQVSRHPERPKTQDYVEALFTDVVELHGDRLFGDDAAMFTGLATIGDHRVAVLGHSKGRNTKENIARNFGSPHPEGFRKARRVMRLADRFGLAIAECLATLAGVRAPVVVVGIGEGGSGGALAIGFGNRLIMLENAYYSVISPEMCATILHKDAGRASEAAACLQATADDLVRLGIADEIVREPSGGAHRDPDVVFEGVRDAVTRALDSLAGVPADELVSLRHERLRKTGVYTEGV
jgi:acetyl-CoA carboxylase carboxyl transferase subunit alpha